MPTYGLLGDAATSARAYALDCLGSFRRDFQSYQQMLNLAYADLHPKENGQYRSNVFLSGEKIRSWEEVAKSQAGRSIMEWPHIAGMALQNVMTRSNLVVRAVTHGYTALSEAEALRAEKFEFANKGVLHMLNRQIVEEEQGWHSFQQVVAANLVFLHKCIVFSHVVETYDGSGEAEVHVSVLDPRSFYHDRGRSKTRRYAWERWFQKHELEDRLREFGEDTEYHLPSGWDDAKADAWFRLTDMWVQEPDPDSPGKLLVHEYMTCGAEDDTALPPRRIDVLKCPFTIAAVRSDPSEASSATGGISGQQGSPEYTRTQDTMLQGEPFYYRVRETIHQIEGYEEQWAKGAALRNLPPMVDELLEGGADDEKNASPKIGESIQVRGGTRRFSFLQAGGSASDLSALIEEKKMVLNGVVPQTLISLSVNPGDAGLLIDKEIAHSERVLAPYVIAGSSLIEGTLRSVWNEFRRMGLRMSVEGEWPSGARKGDTVIIDFDATDMPKAAQVNILWPPQLPQDQMRSVQIMANYVQAGLLGRVDALDQVGKHENAIELVRRADLDRMAQMPPEQDRKYLEFLDGELAKEEDKLRRFTGGSDGYKEQFDLVEILRLRIRRLSDNLLQKPPPTPNPAAPRPSPDTQSNQDQGGASRESQQAGIQLPNVGSLPNPALPAGGR